jgi:hypothetical protein
MGGPVKLEDLDSGSGCVSEAIEQRDFARARELLRGATLSAPPTETDLHRLDLAEDTDSYEHRKEISARFPMLVQAHTALARRLMALQRWDEALEVYDDLLLSPCSARDELRYRVMRLRASIHAKRYDTLPEDFWTAWESGVNGVADKRIAESMLGYIASIKDPSARPALRTLASTSRCPKAVSRFLGHKQAELTALEEAVKEVS